MRTTLALATLLSIGLATPVPSYSVQDGTHGAVASESKVCSQIGIDIQKQGGNAADSVCILKFIVDQKHASNPNS